MSTKRNHNIARTRNIFLYLVLILIPVLLIPAFILLPKEPAPDSTIPSDPLGTIFTQPIVDVTNPMEDTHPVDDTQPIDDIQSIMENMTLSEKIYQLFIVDPETILDGKTSTEATNDLIQSLREHPVGGFIFFANSLVNRQQTIDFLADLQAESKIGLFMAVDEEGGKVSRIGSNPLMGVTTFPNMGKITSEEAAFQVGQTIGSQIRQLGFNVDFAPVADVNSNPKNPIIGERAFSSDPVIASQMVSACVKGFSSSGMISTLKHFPGHGDTKTDSHVGTAETQKTVEQLRECEFLPFQSGIASGAPMVMIGHINAPNITQNQVPASLSQMIVTDLLRNELQFDGLIVTDALRMQAITNHYSSAQACVMALQAGVDILLLPENLQEAHDGILEAIENGVLSEDRINESLTRILSLKTQFGIIQQEA